MGLIRTKQYLAIDVCKRLHRQYYDACRTPAILFSQRRLGPNGKTEAELAMAAYSRAADAACVAAGFPEPAKDEDGDVIHYGVDFSTGEVLLWDGKP